MLVSVIEGIEADNVKEAGDIREGTVEGML